MLQAASSIAQNKEYNKSRAIQLLYARITLNVILRDAGKQAASLTGIGGLEAEEASAGIIINAPH